MSDQIGGFIVLLIILGYVLIRIFVNHLQRVQARKKFERDRQNAADRAAGEVASARREKAIKDAIDACPFKKGAVVKLIGQKAPHMTAEFLQFTHSDDLHVYTVWFDADGKLQRDNFRVDLLEDANGT